MKNNQEGRGYAKKEDPYEDVLKHSPPWKRILWNMLRAKRGQHAPNLEGQTHQEVEGDGTTKRP